jgi:predicted nucleotidyltransferase
MQNSNNINESNDITFDVLDNFSKKEKILPRNWLNPYWKKRSVREMLAEIIKPDDVDVSAIKINEELCPLIWDKDGQLKEDVRNHLLKISAEFIKNCKLEEYRIKDVVIMGSLANYNYTPNSDLDLHILMDFKQFKLDHDLIGEYFKTKKELWNEYHDIKIKGHEVECYIQNVNEPNASIGIYSVLKDGWVRKPLKEFVSIDETNVQSKAADLMNKIDQLEAKFNAGEDIYVHVEKLKDKIKKMRKNGLYKEGEFSTENIVFKILRNSGYLEKLTKLKYNNIDQNLSLNESL